MTPLEKAQWQQQLTKDLSAGSISIGLAVQQIRTQLYHMTQADYARLCQVSEKTLRDVEKGNTDPRISIVESLLRPGGLTLSARVQVNRVATMAELTGR